MSRLEIRYIVNTIKKKFGLDKVLYFPAMDFLEKAMLIIDPLFELLILPDSEMDVGGKTCPAAHQIKLKQSLYDNALAGYGRDRFTVAHEIVHYLFHTDCKIQFARTDQPVPICRNPEWQADAGAAEMLIPAHLVKGMSAVEISQKCGVSIATANYQLSKIE